MIRDAASASTLDLMKASLIIMQESALASISDVLGASAQSAEADTATAETEEAEA
jgi:hypothetical protein